MYRLCVDHQTAGEKVSELWKSSIERYAWPATKYVKKWNWK